MVELNEKTRNYLLRRMIVEVAANHIVLDDLTKIEFSSASCKKLNDRFAEGRPAEKAQLEAEQAKMIKEKQDLENDESDEAKSE